MNFIDTLESYLTAEYDQRLGEIITRRRALKQQMGSMVSFYDRDSVVKSKVYAEEISIETADKLLKSNYGELTRLIFEFRSLEPNKFERSYAEFQALSSVNLSEEAYKFLVSTIINQADQTRLRHNVVPGSISEEMDFYGRNEIFVDSATAEKVKEMDAFAQRLAGFYNYDYSYREALKKWTRRYF